MRILVMEDEPKVSAAVKRALTAERYSVDVTADGRAGIEFAESFAYDLILLDLLLPSLSGIQVLQRIRQNNQCVPILVVTARDSVADKVKLFDLGADDYLTKPFALAELVVRARALLRRGPVNRSSTLRVGDLELDRLSQQVKRQGKRVELTAKEYSLLEYLMQNQDRVLTRDMIVEHVWDHTFDGIVNIVDVHIRHLRTKIGEDAMPTLIRTIRGSGYMIRSDVA